MRKFNPDRYYRTTDPALALIGTRGTLCQWRHRGVGPRYFSLGNRILYLGSDLNCWIESHAVEPADGGERAAGGRRG